MLCAMTERISRLCAVALLLAAAGCTQDSPAPASDPPTSSTAATTPTKPSSTASTAGQTTLTEQDAKLQLSIEQLRGGIKRSQWPALARAMGKPVATWMEGAYGGSYPRSSYDAAFGGWTKEAARLARRDRDTTTNASQGTELTGVVFDRRVVRFYVFASRGRTGGATARVDLRFTAQRRDGGATAERVFGNLYITREGGLWRVFGYDLTRLEVPR